MIAYLDTSALIKKYVNEHGSNDVITHWKRADFIVVSAVAYAELFAALNRKRRESTLTDVAYHQAIFEFKTDWDGLTKIEATHVVNRYIEHLTSQYPIRGFDAIHLASALVVRESEPHYLFFLCADHRLNDAARNEQLQVIDVS